MGKSIDRIAFEFWCGIGDVSDFELWVEDELRKDDPYPDACELFGLDKYEIEKESLQIASKINGFNPESEANRKGITELVVEESKKLIDKKITPMLFCNLIQTLDSKLLVLNSPGAYPDWLGDFWNNCDWCDETWTNENSIHLIELAKKLINGKI